ncbi:MAG: tetratricopeptide repeat protein [Fibromonadales bacterium]|nr:tetratricopeptide repeat protein [Fibromonadales bacterium]
MKTVFSLFCLALCVAFVSCSNVTTLRTKEIKNISEASAASINKRIDSLVFVIDSLKFEQAKNSSRLKADFAEFNLKLGEQGDKSESRMEEISFRLERILSVAQQKSAVTKSAAAGSAVQSVANESSEEMKALYQTSRTDYINAKYAVAYNGFKHIYETLKTGEMAEDALYWMGMCMLDAGQKGNAETLFKNLLEKFPQSMKVCAVDFKLASMAEEAGKATEQKAYLQKLLSAEQCAGSNEFQRAADILSPQ